MTKVISLLLLNIEIQQKIIIYFISSLLVNMLLETLYDEPVDRSYRKLQVDQMPIIEVPEKLNYKDLSEQHLQEHGKPLKSRKPQKNSKAKVPNTLVCPRYQAPHHYLYDNTGGRGQYKCKIYSCCFNLKNYYSKAAIIKCPHCSKTLEKMKKRFLTEPHEFKIRYIYRQLPLIMCCVS